MLAAGDLYKRKLIRIVPTLSNKKLTVEILAEIDRQIERFLLARVAISLIVGAVVWVAFHLVGLEEAGVWGVLSAGTLRDSDRRAGADCRRRRSRGVRAIWIARHDDWRRRLL